MRFEGADRTAEDRNLVLIAGEQSVNDFAGDLAGATGDSYFDHLYLVEEIS